MAGEQAVIMAKVKCPYCGSRVQKYGKTSAGRQRWHCLACGATFVNTIDNAAKLLEAFLAWLLSGTTQSEMPGEGRSFRRKTSRFWEMWPMPPVVEERHRVVYVDGIYLTRKIVVLIACTDEHVLGWYLARSENSKAYRALMRRIAPPLVAVTDGGDGFEKARRAEWPDTKVQRCAFHAFCQVKRYTTTRPKLQAGAELYAIAKALLHVETLRQAQDWTDSYMAWCREWAEFLDDKTVDANGEWEWTHLRLVKARSSLNRLISSGRLFTYLDPDLTADGPLPATNNRLEGGVNAQIRNMLRDHRGMSDLHRVKAVFWWCYMRTENPLPAAEMLRVMPTDDDIEAIYQERLQQPGRYDGPNEWGDGLVWSELHHSTPWRMDWD